MARLVPYVLALAMFATLPWSAHASEAEQFVERLSADVVATLSAEDVTADIKLDKLKMLLDEAADLELLAKLILGRYWRSASETERQDYMDVFRKLVNETLATRLSDYGGETIDVVGSNPVNERDTMVNTIVSRPGGETSYKVDWRIRETDGKSAVIDVVAEGVSLVVTQRSEIGDIVAKSGMSGLNDALRERLRKLNQE